MYHVPLFLYLLLQNSDHILALKPDGVVIGRAVTESDDPTAEAQFFTINVTVKNRNFPRQ